MSTIETRYSLGDVAYGVTLRTAQRRPNCPLCAGEGHVKVVGSERTASCPDCHGRRYDQDDSHMAEQQRATIYRLTIRQVQWRSDRGAAYMAEETGVGSGQLWEEHRVHPSYEHALAACSDAAVVFAYLTGVSGTVGQQTVIRGQDVIDGWEPW